MSQALRQNLETGKIVIISTKGAYPLNTVPHPGRFVIVWRREGSKWLIARVISLH